MFHSKRYGTNVFYKDSIKEVLGDTIGFSDREENLKLSKAAMELMVFIFSEFGKLNKNLILESNFHKADLERLHQMADENRHPVHLSTTLDSFEDFKGYTEYAGKEEIPGDTIYIDADDFSYQTDEKILTAIDEFMKG